MPPRTRSSSRIEELAADLESSLSAAYRGGAGNPGQGSLPLRSAFERFGVGAVVAAIPVEDAMAVAARALQDLFERTGGHGADPATTLAAGIALGAVAREFARFETEGAGHAAEMSIPKQVARLRALHLINRAATADMNPNDLLDTTVRQVAEATDGDACSVMLYDAATDSLALRAATGLNPSSVGAMTIRRGVGITGQAAEQMKSIVASDARSHVGYLDSPAIGDSIYASLIAVPMIVRGSNALIGVLNVLCVEQREFDDDEVTFLETVAGELAVNIENARVHSLTGARLRRKVTELGTLQRVSRMVASSLDLENVLRLISEAAVELIGAEAAAVFRVPPHGELRSDDRELDDRIPHRRHAGGPLRPQTQRLDPRGHPFRRRPQGRDGLCRWLESVLLSPAALRPRNLGRALPTDVDRTPN